MSKSFIAAFKAGAKDPLEYITEEKLVYWYRPTPRGVNCDATDTTMQSNASSGETFVRGRPDGWQSMTDEVFVVALLKKAAEVEVHSGSQTKKFQAPAGISAWAAPMGVGKQKFSVTRDGHTVLSGTSAKDIVNSCVCGIYNFNAYVGTLPAPETIDRLQPDGLAMLTQGLKAPCPTNQLGTSGVSSSARAT